MEIVVMRFDVCTVLDMSIVSINTSLDNKLHNYTQIICVSFLISIYFIFFKYLLAYFFYFFIIIFLSAN